MNVSQALIEAESWFRTRIGYPPLAGAKKGKYMARAFKKGDRVERINEDFGEVRIGMTGTVTEHYGSSCPRVSFDQLGGRDFGVMAMNLRLLVKALDNLQIGDMVEKTKEDRSGPPYIHTFSVSIDTCFSVSSDRPRTILAVLAPGVYALSKTSKQDEFGEIMTAKDLERKGYTVKGAQEEEVPLSVEEAEKRMGLK